MNILIIAELAEADRLQSFMKMETAERDEMLFFRVDTCTEARKMVFDNPYLFGMLFIGKKITDWSCSSDAEEIHRIYRRNPRILIAMSMSKPYLSYEFCRLPSITTLKAPFNREMIRCMLRQVEKIHNIRNSDPSSIVAVYTGREVIRIPSDFIRYAKKIRNGLELETECGILYNRQKMDEFERYAGKMFMRCHGSFLVNLSHIRKFRRTELEMDNGVMIPVSRSYAEGVRRYLDAFHLFISPESQSRYAGGDSQTDSGREAFL